MWFVCGRQFASDSCCLIDINVKKKYYFDKYYNTRDLHTEWTFKHV